MTIERAIEILDPSHREDYTARENGLAEVEEACRMGMNALKNIKQIQLMLAKIKATEQN